MQASVRCGRQGSAIRVSSSGVGQLVEAVLDLHRAADAEVAGRQHVGPLEVEHQEHLRAPDAEAADRADLGDHLLVGELAEPVELELAGLDVAGEVAHVLDLAPREPGRAQLVGLDREQLRRGTACGRRTAPAPGRRSSPPPSPRAAGRRRCAAASRRSRPAGGPGAGSRTRARRAARPARPSPGPSRASCAWALIGGTVRATPAAADFVSPAGAGPRLAPRYPARFGVAGPPRPRLARGTRVSTPRGRSAARRGRRASRQCPDNRPDKRRSTRSDRPRLAAVGVAVLVAAAALALALGDAEPRRGRPAAQTPPEHRRPAHRRPGDRLDAGDEDGQQGDEAQGRDDEALLRQLPALLPLADDAAHRPVRAQPRACSPTRSPTAATASSTSCTATTTWRSGCRTPATRPSYIGKFLNEYAEPDEYGTLPTDVPEGWDDWRVLAPSNAQYFGYTLNQNGVLDRVRRARGGLQHRRLHDQGEALHPPQRARRRPVLPDARLRGPARRRRRLARAARATAARSRRRATSGR